MILTMFILLMSIYTLINGNIFYDSQQKNGQNLIDRLDGKVVGDSEGVALTFVGLTYIICQFTLLYSASSIDILRQPTLALLAFTIVQFMVAMVRTKKTLSTQR